MEVEMEKKGGGGRIRGRRGERGKKKKNRRKKREKKVGHR